VSTPDPASRFTVQQGVIACQTPIIQNSTSTASKHIHSFSKKKHIQTYSNIFILSLDLRRADFGLFKELLGGIPWARALEGRGVHEKKFLSGKQKLGVFLFLFW